MAHSKRAYSAPRLQVLGTAQHALLGRHSAATQQAVRELREKTQKVHAP